MYYGAGFIALCWCAVRMLRGEMSFGSLTAVTQLICYLILGRRRLKKLEAAQSMA